MAIFVFYKKDIELRIFEKNHLSISATEKLTANGFAKINLEIEAPGQEEAIKKLAASIKANEAMLSEFSNDIAFSSLIESILR